MGTPAPIISGLAQSMYSMIPPSCHPEPHGVQEREIPGGADWQRVRMPIVYRDSLCLPERLV